MYSQILQLWDRIQQKGNKKKNKQKFGADLSSFLDVPLVIH